MGSATAAEPVIPEVTHNVNAVLIRSQLSNLAAVLFIDLRIFLESPIRKARVSGKARSHNHQNHNSL